MAEFWLPGNNYISSTQEAIKYGIESIIAAINFDGGSGTPNIDDEVLMYFPPNHFGKRCIAVRPTGWDYIRIGDGLQYEINMQFTIRVYFEDFPNSNREQYLLTRVTKIICDWIMSTPHLRTHTDIGLGAPLIDFRVANVRPNLIFPMSGNYGSEIDIETKITFKFDENYTLPGAGGP